ncbi:aminotransferase class I/II-fold pyridoxal phosphate-dependent enzyme [Paenibacillus radicis (ex Gao et al. 2016)]|uniref:Aminotransferase n=1 Tax=Paenibacillus radicis (ex Gao et al. 2016) TaxID=1737354 RepID=A0A917GY81_9BACL|nr:aminotransferase class I/II-fold pyridoxal phosphate-dependent enzyme [Paenibacillus radicis (ex Gao et al. 2016)]GGG61741.1 aminotransferase [Paenibacillus radicis (ex Gao et al. 2016)]
MRTVSEYLSPVVREIPPSGIRKFFNAAEAGRDIISLGVGEPDFTTPKAVRDAAARALDRGYTKYTENAGILELREEISAYLDRGFGIRYDPASEVLVTVGGSEAIDLALRVLLSPGDELLVPVPNYIAYSPITKLNGGVAVEVETFASDGFKLTAEALKKQLTPRSKLLLVSYPNNPTGAVMTYEDWLPIAKLVEEHDLIVLSDEIYAELTYGRTHVSFASLPGMKDRTIVISGFSKAFAMTGWRMGYACGHPDLIGAMCRVHQYTLLSAPTLAQIAAIESLRHGLGDKDEMIMSYNHRRKMFVQGLRDIGLSCHEPEGAFYVFPSIASTGLSSQTFAERLLQEGRVAAVPGDVFGPGGEGFIRCSYAASEANLLGALERMDSWLRTLNRVGV